MINLQKHDAFRYQGLGKAGLKLWIWFFKQNAPVSIDKILSEINLSKATIYKKINVMQSVEMIIQEDNKWRANKDIDLDKIAEILGTYGIAEKQRRRHQREREAYNLYINKNTIKTRKRDI